MAFFLAIKIYCTSKSLSQHFHNVIPKTTQRLLTYDTKFLFDIFVIILTSRYKYFTSCLWLCDKITEDLIGK